MAKKRVRKRRVFRLIPITVTMLSLVLIIKVNELYLNSRELRELYGIHDATAEEKAADSNSAKPADAAAGNTAAPTEGNSAGGNTADAGNTTEAAKTDGNKTDSNTTDGNTAKPDEKKEGDAKEGDKKDADGKAVKEPTTYGTGKTKLKDIEALKAKENQQPYTQSEVDLLDNLSRRRDELDQREKDLDIKAQVLEATEKRIGDKMTEMKTMQTQLEKVVALYNEKQDTQIKSLVKIYENMKPNDAAAIFNEMDMPILLEVIDKMSERKVAPVLAGMDPKRAKDVTQELAAMRRTDMTKVPPPGVKAK